MNKIKQPPIPLPCRLCGVTSHSVIVQHGEGIGGFFITPMTEEERKEKRKAHDAAYRAANQEKVKAAKAAWRTANREKEKARRAELHAANPEKRKAHDAAYRAANQEKVKARIAAWKKANPEKIKVAKAAYQKQRRTKDPIFAISSRLRTRLALVFKNNGFKRQSCTEKMLGCTFKKFTKHIERQFTDGMSWDNRSEWHLDHIIPLSCATTIEGLEKLSHYTNIRPLWAAENASKSNKLVLE